MADSMRGSRLGATSYESDSGVYADRLPTVYICPVGHRFTMPFSVEAEEIPDTWECECGESAVRLGAGKPEVKPIKIPKSHYDMLLERRTKKDLESLLKERMETIRKPKKAS